MHLPILADATDGFPVRHRVWSREAFGALPHESLATCNDCAMLPGAGEIATSAHFDPGTKCCMYLPSLANFLVGEVLADASAMNAEGRSRVRERIAKRIAVTPLAVASPRALTHLYGLGPGNFGRTRALRCPYFAEKDGCTVWAHRNAVCATWFCKHERGGTGRQFWQALEALLGVAERALARRCLLALEIGDDALAALFPHAEGGGPKIDLDELDGRVDERAYDRVWGTWLGREEAFFEACAGIVATLSWKDVRVEGGSELALRERMARSALDALLNDELPARARLAPLSIDAIGSESTRVVGYSPLDPLDIPSVLLPALECFRGETIAKARARLKKEHGLSVDLDLVRKMIDFGLLTPEP